jgi:hypothetical protein
MPDLEDRIHPNYRLHNAFKGLKEDAYGKEPLQSLLQKCEESGLDSNQALKFVEDHIFYRNEILDDRACADVLTFVAIPMGVENGVVQVYVKNHFFSSFVFNVGKEMSYTEFFKRIDFIIGRTSEGDKMRLPEGVQLLQRYGQDEFLSYDRLFDIQKIQSASEVLNTLLYCPTEDDN